MTSSLSSNSKKGFTLISNRFTHAVRSKSFGFTLIELLVVISIIAILGTIGVTVFSGAQTTARDGRRRGDIESIAKALEIKKGSSSYYNSLTGGDFAEGNIPKGTTTYPYCVRLDPTVPVPKVYSSATWDTAYCPDVDSSVQLEYTPINNNQSLTITASTLYWRVCAKMEDATIGWYCRASSQ
ncbi:MAG: type II secretion system protein [Candidatus Daviesbacteria bacterium]|nr:type II secretion system protein [Candidatus Daviesbacteria bacterium]